MSAGLDDLLKTITALLALFISSGGAIAVINSIKAGAKRRAATSEEHGREMAMLEEIRAAQKQKESKQVRNLKRRITELERQLEEAQQNTIGA